MNLYHLSLEMENSRDRYKPSTGILIRSKESFMSFVVLSMYEKQDKNEFCFSAQRFLLGSETDSSKREQKNNQTDMIISQYLFLFFL